MFGGTNATCGSRHLPWLPWLRTTPASAWGLVLTLATATAAHAADPVIEFYNAHLDHYFLTISAVEASGIDSGAAGPGWHRTARVFGAFSDSTGAPADAGPVCRFYGNAGAGGPNSHFYTADPAECAAVKQDPGWLYEGIAFHVRAPVAGACPAGTIAVLRNYNRRLAQRDSNHRYGTDRELYDEMTAIGWSAEGIVMCGEPGVVTPARTAPIVASGASPLTAGCERINSLGNFYPSSEVEPHLAINPKAPDNLVGVWQQDRWDNGGARGLVTGVSFDGGRSWQKTSAPFSRCTGGTAANGGDYFRASDPWVTFTPDGIAFQSAIAFRGAALTPGSVGNVAVSRSRDGGVTWDTPTVLIQDTGELFNDKETITADLTDGRYVYAVWDRITTGEVGQTWFARTTNAGDTWEPARQIYDPGPGHSTLNNQIVVLPDGTLINFFSELTIAQGRPASALLAVMRSTDKGVTWSPRIRVADALTVGTLDPENGTRIRDGTGLGHIAADAQGRLFIVWQDARLSGGLRDAVLITRSDDGGLTWSVPARVNAEPGVAAFIPAVAVARDGTIGVTYYDFRSNTGDPSTLLTDYWLARSSDGLNWIETRVDGPFDYAVAPNAGGLFLGDYQGIATVGRTFVPFYGRTNAADTLNRSDVAAAFIPGLEAVGAADALARSNEQPKRYRAEIAGNVNVGAAWGERVRENLAHAVRSRTAGALQPASPPR